MIFVSLMQQKTTSQAPEPVAKTPVKVKVVTTEAPKPKPTKYSVTATFNFYGTEQNVNIPKGSYVMQGSFDEKTRELKLGGVGWLERPQNYDMVPLSGKINESENIFTGRIEFIGCKTFTLKRVTNLSGSPISGDWKGSYDCSQGMTGLTLSVE